MTQRLVTVRTAPARARPRCARGVLTGFALLLIGGTLTMAEPAPTLDAAVAAQKLAEAQAAAFTAQATALKAETDALAARRALLAAQTTDPAAAVTLAAARQASDLATAQQTTAAAQAATVKSQTAIPDSGYTGEVKTGDKAGVVEAQLLASKAIAGAGRTIATELVAKLQGKTLVLAGAADLPNFGQLLTFRAQHKVLTESMTAANAAIDTVLENNPIPTDTTVATAHTESPLLLAGAGLDAANKLLGFFRTDYTVNGVDVKLDDLLLVNSIARGLAEAQPAIDVRIPALYSPPVRLDTSPALKSYEALMTLRSQLQGQISQATARADTFTALADAEKDPAKKTGAQYTAATLKSAAAAATAVAAMHDTLLTKLTTPDDKGNVPLATILQLDALDTVLQANGALMVVRITAAGGSFYTRRNLWTFFGGMPFFNMGGAVVTYTVFTGASGSVLASGVLPLDGGYVKTSDLPHVLKRP